MKKELIGWKLINDTPSRIERGNKIVLYDMYEIELTYNTGETKIVKVFCEPDTINAKTADVRLKNEFFGRTFLKGGLMEKQGREDFIFLGKISHQNDGRYGISRTYKMPEFNESAQDFFDKKAYPMLKKAFEQQQQQNQPNSFRESIKHNPSNNVQNQQGRHYAISDIHGYYGSYQQAIDMLKPNDVLYVIGDVIDRGENGIDILQDIMSRPQQVQFFLGNHELQMLRSIDIVNKFNLSISELHQYCDVGSFVRSIRETKKELNEPCQRWESADQYQRRIARVKSSLITLENKKKLLLQNITRPKQLTDDDMQLLSVWLKSNEGWPTYTKYSQLPENKKQEIYNFLSNSLIMEKKQINNTNFLMVHAAPPNSSSFIKLFENAPSGGALRYSDVKNDPDLVKHCLEARDATANAAIQLWKQAGYKTLIGHTPSGDGKIKKNDNLNSVCIDTGCSMNGKLTMYSLEDEQVVAAINPIESALTTQPNSGIPR